MVLPEKDKAYTYRDYLAWVDNLKGELIEGIPYAMAGTTRGHQKAHRAIQRHLEE